VVFGKRRLDRRLADSKPVEGDVELVLIDRAEAELLAETRAGRVRRQRAGGGKLGAGIEQTADDEGQDKIATAVAVRAEQAVETDLARRSEGGSDVPCGSERMMVIACWSLGTTVPPLSSILKPAMRSAGQSERLSRVRFLTLPPSR